MPRIITVPLHIGDFLSGTLHMDATETGAYIMLLLAHYQVGEKGLPNDDKKLARIARVTTKTWARIRPVLEAKFVVTHDFWRSSKVVDVLRKVSDISSAQRAKALKRHAPPHATAQPRQCQPKPKPLKKDNTNVLSKERTKKDALEELSIDHVRDWLNQKRTGGMYLTIDEDRLLEYFKDYCRSKRKVYTDYAAAFRNSFEWEIAPKRQEKRGKFTADDVLRERLAELDREEAAINASYPPVLLSSRQIRHDPRGFEDQDCDDGARPHRV